MAKFYSYGNASRRLRVGDYTFSFDVVGPFGGGWEGVLRLDDADQIAAIETIAARFGVEEITEDAYNALLKKKLNSPRSSPDIIRLPVSAQTLERVDRVALRDPSGPTTPKVEVATVSSKPTLDEALVLGQAPYVDPLDARSNKKGRKKG